MGFMEVLVWLFMGIVCSIIAQNKKEMATLKLKVAILTYFG